MGCKLLTLFDYMTTAFICRLFIKDRALPSAREILVAEIVTDTQQHRLLGNRKNSQVSRITTVSSRLASSDVCYEAFTRVCKELSHKEIFLALMYFTPAKLCRALLEEGFCTDLFALCTRLLFGKVQSFDSYHTNLYKAAIALLEEMKSAATAAGRPLREVLLTQVPVSGSEEMGTTQESVAAAMRTFNCSRTVNKKAAQDCLRPLRFELSTAIGANFSEETPEPTFPAGSAYLSPSSFLLLPALLSAAPHVFVSKCSQPSWKYSMESMMKFKRSTG